MLKAKFYSNLLSLCLPVSNKLAANLILSFANDYWGSTLLNVKTYLVSTLTLLIWVDNSKGGLKEGEGCIQT